MQNPIGEADLEWIFARNGEGTEQLQNLEERTGRAIMKRTGKLL